MAVKKSIKLRDSKRLGRNLLSTSISNTQTRQQQTKHNSEQVKGVSSALHVVKLQNFLPEDAVVAKKLYL